MEAHIFLEKAREVFCNISERGGGCFPSYSITGPVEKDGESEGGGPRAIV